MGTKDFLLRLDAQVHELAVKAAAEAGISVSEYYRRAIGEKLSGEGNASSVNLFPALEELREVLSKMQDGYVLISRARLPPLTWDGIMDEGSS